MLLLLAPEGFWRTRERQAGVAEEREEKKERQFAASESYLEGTGREAAKAQGKPKLCGLVSALTEV